MLRNSSTFSVFLLISFMASAWFHESGRASPAPSACVWTSYLSIDGCLGASAYLNANLSYLNPDLLDPPGTPVSSFTGGTGGALSTTLTITTSAPGIAVGQPLANATGATAYPTRIIACPTLTTCGSPGNYTLSWPVNIASGTALTTTGTIFQYAAGGAQGLPTSPPFHSPLGLVNWNVPGKDFPVGIGPCVASGSYTCPTNPASPGAYCDSSGNRPCSHDTAGNVVPLIDASQYDWVHDPIGTGCVARSNWSKASSYVITCSISGTVNIAGFDFGPALATNSNNPVCVGLTVNDGSGGAGGTLNFENNRVFWSAGSYSKTGDNTCLMIAPAPSNGPAPINLFVNITYPWTINVLNNRVDGNGENAYNTVGNPQFYGINTLIKVGNPGYSGIVRTAMSVKYNYVTDIAALFAYVTYACNGYDFSDNVIHNIGEYSGGNHSNVYLTSVGFRGAPRVALQHCPNFVYGSADGSPSLIVPPVASPNGWAGSVWGTWSNYNVRNNVVWVDSAIRGLSTAPFTINQTVPAPELLDIQNASIQLNIIIPNPPQDPGGRIWMFFGGIPTFTVNTTSGGGYNSAYQANSRSQVGDILQAESILPSDNLARCAPGASPTSYTAWPTFMVVSETTVNVADYGNCGHTEPKRPNHTTISASGTGTSATVYFSGADQYPVNSWVVVSGIIGPQQGVTEANPGYDNTTPTAGRVTLFLSGDAVYPIGSQITVSGIVNSGGVNAGVYNGTYTVTDSGPGFVVYANSNTNTVTSVRQSTTYSSPGYNGTVKVTSAGPGNISYDSNFMGSQTVSGSVQSTARLVCLKCASSSFPPGTDTGWTISNLQFNTDKNASQDIAFLASRAIESGELNGGFINYEHLILANNILDDSGTFYAIQTYAGITGHSSGGGQYLSCFSPPQLPRAYSAHPSAGLESPFFSVGLGGSVPVPTTSNVRPDGSTARNAPWAAGNGC